MCKSPSHTSRGSMATWPIRASTLPTTSGRSPTPRTSSNPLPGCPGCPPGWPDFGIAALQRRRCWALPTLGTDAVVRIPAGGGFSRQRCVGQRRGLSIWGSPIRSCPPCGAASVLGEASCFRLLAYRSSLRPTNPLRLSALPVPPLGLRLQLALLLATPVAALCFTFLLAAAYRNLVTSQGL